MFRATRAALWIAALSFVVPTLLAERPRVRLGGVSVGASYSSGGYWPGAYYPGAYWNSLYSPFWSSPFIHPGLYGGFAAQPNMGEVKLKTTEKDGSVYIDGAFAGTLSKMKSFWLEPGVYSLSIEGDGQREYRKRIYVLSGRTLRLDAQLAASSGARP